MTDLTQLENHMVIDSYWNEPDLPPYQEYDPTDTFDPPEPEEQPCQHSTQ